MKEYIERAALLNEFCRDNCERQYEGTCHNRRMTDTIADFPAADVVEVRHGRWMTTEGLGTTMDKTMTYNVEKLMKRYPDGFSVERSVHRES